MNEDIATPLVIEMAKVFVRLMREIAPDFDRAFLRFRSEPAFSEAKASYIEAERVEIVDAIGTSAYFRELQKLGGNLFQALGKLNGVLLLMIDSNLDYKFEFEWSDLDRWRISKLNGGSGLPAGI